MKKRFFLLAFFLFFNGCNQDFKNGIQEFEEKNFNKSTKIFSDILNKNEKNINENILFNLGNSLYKEEKFLEAEKNFKKIYKKKENKKITKLQNSGKIEYQLGNTKYKIGEKIENPKKLSNERKLQKIFGKNFKKIIENYQESIANYELGIKKNNINLEKNGNNYELKNLNKLLKENLEFVKKKLEEIKKEKKKEEEKSGKKLPKKNDKGEPKPGKNQKNKKNQLSKNELEQLKNELEQLNQQEIELKGGFNRFGKNNFKLKAEPGKMDMQTIEEFLNSEKNKNEGIFDSGEKNW